MISKKYFSYIIGMLLCANILLCNKASADVCLKDGDAIDVITLLDSSEKDIKLLGSCRQLVKDLYQEVEVRDKQIEGLTQQIVSAKQETISYKAAAVRWRKVAWYTGGLSAIVIAIQILPKVL